MFVRELMSQGVACCTPETNLQEVARMMAERHCGAIPVVQDLQSMKPVGIVTDRDITTRAVACGRNPLEMRAGDCMSEFVVTVRPDTELEVCCRLMEEHLIRRVPVVDDAGRCCGMVSQADIAENAPESQIAEVLRDISQPTQQERRIEVH